MTANMIGLDIAKSVFQAHCVNAAGEVVQKRLRRSQVVEFFAKQPPSLVGIEACGSSHYWARTIRALGHEVRLVPAAYVKPFVRRNKNDARDAAGIYTALGQPGMTFVSIKSVEQQAERGIERSRELLVKQRTQLMNSIRGQMAEYGIVKAQGLGGLAELTAMLEQGEGVPAIVLPALRLLARQADSLKGMIADLDKQILARVRENATMRRLMSVPGVGPILAHAVVAAIGEGRQFGSARDFAAWAGMTPQEHSSANKKRQKGISRQGDSRLRQLFALGASTIMRNARSRPERATQWQRAIMGRRPMKVAVLAQAAKSARIVWAILVSGETYQPRRVASGALATAP
jgi:transposase